MKNEENQIKANEKWWKRREKINDRTKSIAHLKFLKDDDDTEKYYFTAATKKNNSRQQVSTACHNRKYKSHKLNFNTVKNISGSITMK